MCMCFIPFVVCKLFILILEKNHFFNLYYYYKVNFRHKINETENFGFGGGSTQHTRFKSNIIHITYT